MSRKRPEHSDNSYSRPMRHFDVFRSITHVEALRGSYTKAADCSQKWRGTWLAPWRILAAHSRCKEVDQTELAQLPRDDRPIARCHQRQNKSPMKPAEHAAGAGNECHLSGEVTAPPEFVDFLPTSAGNSGSSMHAIGVGRVVPFVMFEVQGNLEGANYLEVGLTVGAIGVQQRSVPVEQNGAKDSASA